MKRIFLLAFLGCFFATKAQISITATGTAFTQNFDGIGNTAISTLPNGFKFGAAANATDWNAGLSATTQSRGTSGVGIFSLSSSGGNYNLANGDSAASLERAIGVLNSGSFGSSRSIILKITNNTGVVISDLAITFDYEKYRSGTRVFNWTFFHGATSSPTTSATSGDNSFVGDANNTTVSNPPTTTSKTVNLTGLAINNATDYYLRWTITGVGGSSNGQAIGIDNFSITATGSGLDVTPPTVTTLTPTDNATNVGINTNLQILFSEAIAKGTGNIYVKKLSDNSTHQTIDVTAAAVTVSASTATISISPSLLNNTDYYIEIDAGSFTDIAPIPNNFAGITGNTIWNFKTDIALTPGILNNNYSFTNCNTTFITDGWRQFSVLGNSQFWTCSNTGRTSPVPVDSSMVMNAFVASNNNPLNEDWLISPPFNLVGTSAPYLDFYSRTRFTGNGLVLKVSTNYISGTNPNTATWTTLNGNFPAANTDVWTLSNNIDLTPFIAPSVFIAWVYINPTTAASSRWTLDDIIVNAGCTPPSAQPTALSLTPSIVSIAGSFAPSSPAADEYLVLMSTAPSLTAQPLPGTSYLIDDVIGNATVISASSATSFTVNNLTPFTDYYFFVYSYNTLQSCYQLLNPLLGTTKTLNVPNCTPPSTQVTNLTATNITGTSMDINYNRGNGDNILVVARVGSSVNQNPYRGVNYPVNSQIGTGNFVIYNGPAATFNYATLTQSTTYYFALYEYFNTDYCYNLAPLTGNFTTLCTAPVNITALAPTAGNTTVALTWTNPNASCYDEILVVASNAPITGLGGTFAGAGNTVYSTPNQVVFRGIGNAVTITALTNGTPYYFKVFTRNTGVYSSGVSAVATPYDPSAGFTYMYGNLHSHSSFSDGNTDDLSKQPIDDYRFARDANCMDFLGISEHNHAAAGMAIADYTTGFNQANTVNGEVGTSGFPFVTLWGMEWGVISGGGHLLVFGFDNQLLGWDAGNYDILTPKNDYTTLFNTVNAQPNAFTTLAHPNFTDYGGIVNTFNATADNAVFGVALENGPSTSSNITYSDFPTQERYMEYYKTMLSKGYKLGPTMDGDNHKLTHGRQSANRTVVLTTTRSRADLVSAIRAMRFYASNDCNLKIDYKILGNSMGSSITSSGLPTINVTLSDIDAADATPDSVYIFGAKIGDPIPTTAIKAYAGTNTILFDATDVANTQPDNTTYYYFINIKQADGNRATTSPIWYTRNDLATPITLVNFKGTHLTNKTILLEWYTAQEQNSKLFIVERSLDGGRSFEKIGTVNAKGFSASLSNYQLTDLSPAKGLNFYRLKQVDIDGKFTYSKIIVVNIDATINPAFTISPNPATDVAYINSNSLNTQKVSWQLFDEMGRKIVEQNSLIDKIHPIKLNVTNFKKGLHIVKVINQDNSTSTLKLIIE